MGGREVSSAVQIMEITRQDKIIDPRRGTGGFLIEDLPLRGGARHRAAGASERANLRAQADLGPGQGRHQRQARPSDSRCPRRLSQHPRRRQPREHHWKDDYPHLQQPLKGRVVHRSHHEPTLRFGQRLKVSPADARCNRFTISNATAGGAAGDYASLETGLGFLERAHRLLVTGGKLGIVLLEPYVFGSTYKRLPGWLDGRLELRGVLNIPMEASQGFCRAETNFYIFEKV